MFHLLILFTIANLDFNWFIFGFVNGCNEVDTKCSSIKLSKYAWPQ